MCSPKLVYVRRPASTGSRIIVSWIGGGPCYSVHVAEPARRLEQPVLVGPAAGAASKVDRRTPVNTGWVLPGELQLDVRRKDLGDSSAAGISLLGAQKLIQVAKIGHRAASFFEQSPFPLLPSS